jgi:hypothetical protein
MRSLHEYSGIWWQAINRFDLHGAPIMSQRPSKGALAALGTAVLLGIAGIVYLVEGSAQATTPEARAADEKRTAPEPHYHLSELGPKRTCNCDRTGMGLELTIRASREVQPSAGSQYYVTFHFLIVNEIKLAARDVDALVKLHAQLKDKRKSKAKAIATAEVWWAAYDYSNAKEVALSYSLEDGLWSMTNFKMDREFIPMLTRVLEDIEGLKAAKPSLTW